MWTISQQTAIDANCADNLVSAAAGSGKTAVMVERIVSRVLSGKVDIDRLLVVTFTNAAASELKSRLMNKIMEALDDTDNPDRLNRQLVLINNASICTIDSFCLNVLRNNFFRLGLDPGFKIADTTELELMKADVLNTVFDEYYAAKDAEFLKLVDCYTSKSDDELFSLIQKIYLFTNSMPGGTDELEAMAVKFCQSEIWKDYFITKSHRICQRAIDYYDEAIAACSYSDELEKVRLNLLDEKNNFVIAIKKDDWNGIRKAVLGFEFGRLVFPRGTMDTDKAPIKEPRDAGKKLADDLRGIFVSDFDELLNDTESTYISLRKLIEITRRFANRFSEAKMKAGLVDFVDIEHMTLKLLKDDDGNPNELAFNLMAKYEEIYIDEYQDCNGVQEKLFSLISRANENRPNMFMVGDMKQSIYGFRGSQPQLFKHKADTYSPYTDDGSFNKIVLNKNFRSRKGIIDAVNSIFSQIMSEDCGELDYTDEEYLYLNDGAYEDVNPDMNKVDVVILETNSSLEQMYNGEVSEMGEELKKTEAEAIYVANKINSIVGSGYKVYDKEQKKYRDAKYSDIVLLLRSGADKAETFNRILTAAGIPVYCDMGGGYYDCPEIVFLTSFLKIIDNPLDDIALLSVMRHPVFKFDENDFVSIRLAKPKGFFYNSIKTYLRENNDDLSQRLCNFISVLKDFYDKSKYLSADKLLWEIIRDTEYMSYLSFLPNSELRKGNVKALISRAYDFEKTSYKGIFDFIRYIDSLKKNDKDIEPAKTLSDDEDVVRIMTIHKSKGLEFPIVFLCDCAKKFNDSDIIREKVLLHRELGFGLNFYDYESRYYYELPHKKLLKDKKLGELLSEEMRVLYVALTRPREKLFVIGSMRNVKSRIDNLVSLIKHEPEKLSAEAASCARSYMDWILLALLRNKNTALFSKGYGYKAVIDDGSRFDVSIVHKNSEILEIDDECQNRDFETADFSKELRERVENILDFKYPYAHLSDIPSNMSVTELKRMENEDEDVYNYYHTVKLTSPRFYAGNGEPTPAEIGTFTHLVMEKLDFSKTDTPDDIRKQISSLTNKGFLTESDALYINDENIARIFKTPLGIKLKERADSVKREFSFKYLMDASVIDSHADKGEKIVIQGMIDIYFEDNDGSIVIADYKTDKVRNNIEEIKTRYAPQLKYYKIALEKALGKKVSKTYLILLDCGEIAEC